MYCWQNVGKIANIAPTLPTDGQRWPTMNVCWEGPLTDDQGSRARGPLMQIFNNLYAKPVRNLRVLT